MTDTLLLTIAGIVGLAVCVLIISVVSGLVYEFRRSRPLAVLATGFAGAIFSIIQDAAVFRLFEGYEMTWHAIGIRALTGAVLFAAVSWYSVTKMMKQYSRSNEASRK